MLSLDTYTNFAAQLSLDDRSAASRLERYAYQSAARKLLPDERVSFCLRYLKPNSHHVLLMRSESRNSGRFGNLEVCGSVWVCPICSPHVAEHRRSDIARAISVHRARGGAVYLVTRTVRHTSRDKLSDVLTPFRAAERRMTNTGAYKRLLASYGALGTITALEVTYGDESGWHPHTHTLLFLAAAAPDLGALVTGLYQRWEAAALAESLTVTGKAFTVQPTYGAVDDYVAKWGRGPTMGIPWGVEDEMTKQHTKRGRARRRYAPFGLLGCYYYDHDEAAGSRFVEFASCFKGRSQLRWSPGLRAALVPDEQERSDLALADTMPRDFEEWGMLDFEDWQAVDFANQRGELANLVGAGDRAGVLQLVSRCRALHWQGVHAHAVVRSMSAPAYNESEGLAWF